MFLQSARSSLPKSITAIFLSARSDYAHVQQLAQMLKQVASDLTIVMTGSHVPDGANQFSADKLYFIQPQTGTDSADLGRAVQCAIELSPGSESFLVFANPDTSALSHYDLKKIARKHEDYLFRSSLGCMTLSKRYAMHIAATREIPSVNNAIRNGFSSPMSIPQIIHSPKDAVRQYSTVIKFGTVGASGVAVNLIVLTLLKITVGALVANAIAQELSIVNNFVWNDRFTFRSFSAHDRFFDLKRLCRFVKYNLVSLLSLSVNETVFYIAFSQFHVYYITSALLAIATAFVVNYFGSSRWAWARTVSLSVKD